MSEIYSLYNTICYNESGADSYSGYGKVDGGVVHTLKDARLIAGVYSVGKGQRPSSISRTLLCRDRLINSCRGGVAPDGSNLD